MGESSVLYQGALLGAEAGPRQGRARRSSRKGRELEWEACCLISCLISTMSLMPTLGIRRMIRHMVK